LPRPSIISLLLQYRYFKGTGKKTPGNMHYSEEKKKQKKPKKIRETEILQQHISGPRETRFLPSLENFPCKKIFSPRCEEERS
jgi:hypothetical protein